MTARAQAMLAEITCAAPAYIARFGMPANVDALDGHRVVGFHSSATGALLPLEFSIHGVLRNVRLPATVAVSGAESLVAAARLGLGLIQAPRYHVERDLEQGTLVPILPPSPTPCQCSIPRTGSFHRASACSSIGSSRRFALVEMMLSRSRPVRRPLIDLPGRSQPSGRPRFFLTGLSRIQP